MTRSGIGVTSRIFTSCVLFKSWSWLSSFYVIENINSLNWIANNWNLGHVGNRHRRRFNHLLDCLFFEIKPFIKWKFLSYLSLHKQIIRFSLSFCFHLCCNELVSYCSILDTKLWRMNTSDIDEIAPLISRPGIPPPVPDNRPSFHKKLAVFFILASTLFERMAFFSLENYVQLFFKQDDTSGKWNTISNSMVLLLSFSGNAYEK